ncbi:kinetochore protein Spc24 [Scleropages formosus]|uniref:Kinetochore protein Spc24 n=2 Tax=Scleropages formosus TaxID=113540 RepID=A0A8C9RVN2_SCLFO|nr:kinetochore protein Spc24 [Scleropages formosus]XP_018594109.1 kinetochore protein Spc24 [Scleropages formosus]
MVSLDKGLQRLEETEKDLFSLINSSNAENAVRAVREKRQLLFELHANVEKSTTQLLSDLVQAQERVGQKLLDMESQKNEVTRELDSMEHELQRYRARSHTMDAEMQFLQQELENLRSSEKDMQALQQEVDEDTTEVIPSAIYLAQLYHKVTKIKWEHSSEPGILQGVHYGDDLATPINVDTSMQSKCAISEYLWNFVSTEW